LEIFFASLRSPQNPPPFFAPLCSVLIAIVVLYQVGMEL
jgi:hypothetical protein